MQKDWLDILRRQTASLFLQPTLQENWCKAWRNGHATTNNFIESFHATFKVGVNVGCACLFISYPNVCSHGLEWNGNTTEISYQPHKLSDGYDAWHVGRRH